VLLPTGLLRELLPENLSSHDWLETVARAGELLISAVHLDQLVVALIGVGFFGNGRLPKNWKAGCIL